MPPSDVLNLVVGVLELALALVVLPRLVAYGRSFPWLVALVVFFAVRGADRVLAGVSGDELEALTLVADVVLIVTLVLLIVGLPRTIRALSVARDEARWREDEYARALEEYRVLARHRLANPLTAIRGGVATLADVEDLDPDARRELLDMIAREVERLETISLEPVALEASEHGLEPSPRPRV